MQVGVNGVSAEVLQLVSLQFVHQPDAPALVPADVEHDAAAFGCDGRESSVELRTAVAAQRVEDVASEALRVHPHEQVSAVADLALDQRNVLTAIDETGVADRAELTVRGGHTCLGDAC